MAVVVETEVERELGQIEGAAPKAIGGEAAAEAPQVVAHAEPRCREEDPRQVKRRAAQCGRQLDQARRRGKRLVEEELGGLHHVPSPGARGAGSRGAVESVQGFLDQLGDRLVRWVFVEVTPEAFHWRGEVSEDGGRSWTCETEFLARRRVVARNSPLASARSGHHIRWEWTDRPGLEVLSLAPMPEAPSPRAARSSFSTAIHSSYATASSTAPHGASARHTSRAVRTDWTSV